MMTSRLFSIFFFFNDTATTEIYTLSLHDALPLYSGVADILGNGEIGVESKALSEIAALCTHFARRHSEDVCDSGTGFHHAGKNLESRRFSCPVWSDQSKDLALANLKRDSPDCFDDPIFFVKLFDVDRRV